MQSINNQNICKEVPLCLSFSNVDAHHCVKSVQIWSFFWSVFSVSWAEYRDLFRKSPYSARMQENTD